MRLFGCWPRRGRRGQRTIADRRSCSQNGSTPSPPSFRSTTRHPVDVGARAEINLLLPQLVVIYLSTDFEELGGLERRMPAPGGPDAGNVRLAPCPTGSMCGERPRPFSALQFWR